MTTLFVVAVELYKVFVRSMPWFENPGSEKELVPLGGLGGPGDVGSENEGKQEKIFKV